MPQAAKPKPKTKPRIVKGPRPNDANWKPKCTKREIAEAAAYLRRHNDPQDTQAEEEHIAAWNALMGSQHGDFGCWRCAGCAILVYGRCQGDPCANCKKPLRRWEP